MSTQPQTGMEHHPDIVEMRERAELVTSTPRGQGIEALATLAGLFLAISPWVVGFSGVPALRISNLIVGLAYAGLMAGFGSAFERTHARAWAAFGLGIWTIVSPWVVVGNAAHARAIYTNAFTGAVMVCLCLVTLGVTVSVANRRLGR